MLQQTSVRGFGPAVRDGKRRVQAVKREGSNHQRGIRIRQMVPESVIALRLLCGTCFYRAEPTDQFQLVELLSIVHGMPGTSFYVSFSSPPSAGPHPRRRCRRLWPRTNPRQTPRFGRGARGGRRDSSGLGDLSCAARAALQVPQIGAATDSLIVGPLLNRRGF